MNKKIFYLKNVFLIAFLGTSFLGKTQEQLGLRIENYSGVNSLALNPAAASATYPLAWDVNLASVGIFGSNNIAFFEKASVFKVASAGDKIAANAALELGGSTNPKVYYDFFNNTNRKYVFVSTRLDLPSFVLNFESGHSFGLVSSVRVMAGSADMPQISNYYLIKQATSGQTLGVDPFQLGGMSWAEIGLNYAYRTDLENGDALSFGATIKYLMPFQGVSINNYTTIRFGLPTTGIVRLDTANTEIAFTNRIDENSKVNGNGLGVDLGAMWVSKPDDEGNYDWKLGLSFLDIGSAKFKEDAEVHRVKSALSFTMSKDDLLGLTASTATTEIFRRISTRALGAAGRTQVGEQFEIALPTAMSLQGDVRLSSLADGNFYVGGVLMQRLVQRGARVLTRPNMLVVAPRWETRWFSAMMPLSLTEWRKFNVGLSGRLAFLVIGTDNLLSFFKQSELSSGDLYIGIKINPFSKGRWNATDGGGGMRGGRKKVDCYRF